MPFMAQAARGGLSESVALVALVPRLVVLGVLAPVGGQGATFVGHVRELALLVAAHVELVFPGVDLFARSTGAFGSTHASVLPERPGPLRWAGAGAG